MDTLYEILRSNSEFALLEEKLSSGAINLDDVQDLTSVLHFASERYIWHPVVLKTDNHLHESTEKNIIIGLASFNFTSDIKHNDFPLMNFLLKGEQYVYLSPKPNFEWDMYYNNLLSLISEAINLNVDILCLPEFNHIYPPESNAHAIGSYTECIKSIHDLIENSNKKIVVIPGSGHCPRRLKNIAPIFQKGTREIALAALDKADNTAFHERKHGHFFDKFERLAYSKRRPAYKRRENIKVPAAHTFPLFRTDFGIIAVLICLDAADLSIIMPLVNMNKRSVNKRIDYVLILAYSANMVIYNLAKFVSGMMDATVCYVNWEDFKKNPPGKKSPIVTREIFIRGLPIKEYQEKWKHKKIEIHDHAFQKVYHYGWSLTAYNFPRN